MSTSFLDIYLIPHIYQKSCNIKVLEFYKYLLNEKNKIVTKQDLK